MSFHLYYVIEIDIFYEGNFLLVFLYSDFHCLQILVINFRNNLSQ
jgi:hypothetical protein